MYCPGSNTASSGAVLARRLMARLPRADSSMPRAMPTAAQAALKAMPPGPRRSTRTSLLPGPFPPRLLRLYLLLAASRSSGEGGGDGEPSPGCPVGVMKSRSASSRTEQEVDEQGEPGRAGGTNWRKTDLAKHASPRLLAPKGSKTWWRTHFTSCHLHKPGAQLAARRSIQVPASLSSSLGSLAVSILNAAAMIFHLLQLSSSVTACTCRSCTGGLLRCSMATN